MASYSLPRGTTWIIVITVTRGGVLVNLTGHRLLCTVRLALVNGTSDAAPLAPLWQGDSLGTGIVLSAQSGATLGQATIAMPASATQALPNPIGGTLPLRYDVLDNDGVGGQWQTESGTIVLLPRVTLSQP